MNSLPSKDKCDQEPHFVCVCVCEREREREVLLIVMASRWASCIKAIMVVAAKKICQPHNSMGWTTFVSWETCEIFSTFGDMWYNTCNICTLILDGVEYNIFNI